MSFFEKERICEKRFADKAPFWHLYTSGKNTPITLTKEADFRFVMNLLARMSFQFQVITIIAFAIMNNHLHLVIAGNYDEIMCFYDAFRKCFARQFPGRGDNYKVSAKPIPDLKTLRNTIVYVNRNGYVVDSSYTPYSYTWSTGRYYFNDIRSEHSFGELTYRQKREYFNCREAGIPSDAQIIDGYVSPMSYCDIKYGMEIFRDAHQYFYMLGKNLESYAELAVEIDDDDYLTDTELFSVVLKITKDKYGCGIRDLKRNQLIEVAKSIHYNYRASNGQIRRMLNLSQYEVDSLFPLSICS